jgi:hypothetical protein
VWVDKEDFTAKKVLHLDKEGAALLGKAPDMWQRSPRFKSFGRTLMDD